jgi:hypothetical protein
MLPLEYGVVCLTFLATAALGKFNLVPHLQYDAYLTYSIVYCIGLELGK